MALKNIYLIRHGQSAENESGILSDGTAPLTAQGRQEATTVAARVQTLKPDTLMASHYLRAQQTAATISEATGLPVETYDFLFENRYPSWTIGKHHRAPDVLESALYIHDQYVEEDFKQDDAESFAELKERGQKTLSLLAAHSGQNIVVVSHGLFIRFLVGLMIFGNEFTGREFKALIHGFNTKNTGVTWCLYDESFHAKPWRLMTWNDHEHLAETNE
ncbi:MAG: hypothetical protein A2589_03540 [Candidatus Vogelbacteria bacterium RIFOXYD1_FULL_46_19]|uniref:Phosphoglycerate mutase n=1 Tax=Candidatus Vogelbacteria bacterium RIFOXYD1_FULL_46_19 TaxID=1802439 RepID=A0A1G2QFB2_9BACT|nr:MAG: hypothetical protein A2589_03540 [Candidatus Vogelbacteria bacterium RIFOXYD1_FULL_46_19]